MVKGVKFESTIEIVVWLAGQVFMSSIGVPEIWDGMSHLVGTPLTLSRG